MAAATEVDMMNMITAVDSVEDSEGDTEED